MIFKDNYREQLFNKFILLLLLLLLLLFLTTSPALLLIVTEEPVFLFVFAFVLMISPILPFPPVLLSIMIK